MRKIKGYEIVVVAGLVLMLMVAALTGLGYLAVSNPNTHEHRVGNYTVLLTANWRYVEATYSTGCIQKAQDLSVENVSAVATTEWQGKYGNCAPPYETIEAEIPDLDISQYKSVVIRRSWSARACGEIARISLYSTLIDGGKEFAPGGIDRGCRDAIAGDVYFNNDGVSISVKSNEGDFVYDANKPLFFKNTVAAGDRQTGYAALQGYSIKGIEVTPFPKAAAPVSEEPAGESSEEQSFDWWPFTRSEKPVETTTDAASVEQEEPGVWARFKAWLAGLFY